MRINSSFLFAIGLTLNAISVTLFASRQHPKTVAPIVGVTNPHNAGYLSVTNEWGNSNVFIVTRTVQVTNGINPMSMVMTNSTLTPSVQEITAAITSAGQLTPLVEHLCASGEVCKVKGHFWRDGRAGETDSFVLADHHPGVYYRTCRLCGLGQSRTEGEWK